MGWAPAYASAAELAHFIGDASVGSDTAELTLAVESASRSVDRCCSRQFGSLDSPESRWFTAAYDTGRRQWIVTVDDFATLDGLVIETVTTGGYAPITGYLPGPVNAVANGGVWTSLVIDTGSPVTPDRSENGVKVTAKWGWPEVPGAVKLATLIQASRLFARRQAPFGVAGNPEVGQLRLLERLDVDLVTSVRPYARVWGAV
ncbi:hypothetical protein [Mycobacterium kubicae]|uniref:hypothetical protein n=1 Tax=Mycobacterium kubicae TaxID=120959 RepID=UPI0007FC62B8|nr:hypothetical protein [Mycobacterium kubicae]OBK42073.1 hypothetical protein A5657_08010 [Mycobacterium kubicae]